jgi:hypothetical protein
MVAVAVSVGTNARELVASQQTATVAYARRGGGLTVSKT